MFACSGDFYVNLGYRYTGNPLLVLRVEVVLLKTEVHTVILCERMESGILQEYFPDVVLRSFWVSVLNQIRK